MRRKETKGISGKIQACSRIHPAPCATLATSSAPCWASAAASNIMSALSPLHQAGGLEIDRGPVAVDHQHDAEPHPHLGPADGDDEQGEDLARDTAPEGAEGHEVDVDRVQDELDRHEHHHAVAAGEHTVDADAEEDRGEDEELVEPHRHSLRATTMAPIRAARRSSETTSKGIR